MQRVFSSWFIFFKILLTKVHENRAIWKQTLTHTHEYRTIEKHLMWRAILRLCAWNFYYVEKS